MKKKDKFLLFFISLIAPIFIKIYFFTIKFYYKNKEIEKKQNKNFIYAFWHGRMMAFTYSHRNKNIVVMVSQHKDGEIIARIIKKMGFKTARGSTTRGGLKALREMIKLAKKGDILAITPDGPKGPRYRAQIGAVLLAKMTNLPIIPITVGFKTKFTLSSWDAFQIPFPFTKGVIIIGKPIVVSNNDNIDEKNQLLENELNKITMEADEFFI